MFPILYIDSVSDCLRILAGTVGLVTLVSGIVGDWPVRAPRCARCRYPAAAWMTTTCPECGFAHRDRSHLFRSHRATRRVAIALLLLAAAAALRLPPGGVVTDARLGRWERLLSDEVLLVGLRMGILAAAPGHVGYEEVLRRLSDGELPGVHGTVLLALRRDGAGSASTPCVLKCWQPAGCRTDEPVPLFVQVDTRGSGTLPLHFDIVLSNGAFELLGHTTGNAVTSLVIWRERHCSEERRVSVVARWPSGEALGVFAEELLPRVLAEDGGSSGRVESLDDASCAALLDSTEIMAFRRQVMLRGTPPGTDLLKEANVVVGVQLRLRYNGDVAAEARVWYDPSGQWSTSEWTSSRIMSILSSHPDGTATQWVTPVEVRTASTGAPDCAGDGDAVLAAGWSIELAPSAAAAEVGAVSVAMASMSPTAEASAPKPVTISRRLVLPLCLRARGSPLMLPTQGSSRIIVSLSAQNRPLMGA